VPAKLATRVRVLSIGHGRKNDDADALSVGIAALTSRTLNTAETDAETTALRGGSVTATASRMFCHPNTVRYRLRKLGEYSGRATEDPIAVSELNAALQAWRLAGELIQHDTDPQSSR
jgi:sugar diacid utilization regulator